MTTVSSCLRLALSGRFLDAQRRQRWNVSVNAQSGEPKLRGTSRSGVKINKDPEDSKALYANARWNWDNELEKLSTGDNGMMCPRTQTVSEN